MFSVSKEITAAAEPGGKADVYQRGSQDSQVNPFLIIEKAQSRPDNTKLYFFGSGLENRATGGCYVINNQHQSPTTSCCGQ